MIDRKNLLSKIFQNKSALQEAVNNQNKTSNFTKDDTYWNAPWDNTKKVGMATIAFLPFGNMFDEVDPELSPYIFTPYHSNLLGKNGKKYFSIQCPSGRKENKECPLCNKFFELFNGSEADKKLSAELGLSRKREYRGNIIILKNDSNPEDVGKIFKWKFGLGIQQKINSKINPIDGDEPTMIHNVYDILPFKLKISEKGGFRNYDTSEWGSLGKTIADYIIPKGSNSEKETFINEILEKLFRVEDFISEKDYHSFEELEKILNDVLVTKNLKPIESSNISVKIEEKQNIGKEIETDNKNLEDETVEDETVEDDIDFNKLFND